MPKSVVDIDLTAEIAALPRDTFTDVAIVGTAEDDSEFGEVEFGEVNRYTDASDVSDDYGDGTDVHEASQAIAEMGAQHWYVLVLEEQHVEDETVESGASVENTPIHGETGVTAEGYDVVYVTDDPVEVPEEATELAVNTNTGEIATGDEVSVDVDYAHIDWNDLDELEERGVNLFALADTHAGRAHIGDLDSATGFASSANMGFILGLENGNQFDSDNDAMEAAHDVAGYVPSGDVLAIAHKSSADVAAHVLGQLSTNDPWFDPFYDGDGYPFSHDSYKSALIGDPGTEGTFEGGDDDGNGPVNVIISVAGVTVLSNSLTTAGAGSDYQYFDIGRTEVFASDTVENALTSLRLREDKIPFTDDGRTQISSTIRGALAEFTGGPNDPFAEIDVHVPNFDDLTEDDRTNREWRGITIDGRLSGNVHQFTLEMAVSV